MPVFTEHSSSSRDLRVLPLFAPPLPRLSPKLERGDETKDKYEVVVVGVCALTISTFNNSPSPECGV